MNRRNDIDALKALGIILMILCHIGFGETTDSLIHSFHMPLFFFVSGYLYKDCKEFKPFLLRKARTLLIPYLVFGTLHFIIKMPMLFRNSDGVSTTLYHLLLFNHDGLPIAGALWFLTALFGTYVLFYFLSKIKNSVLLFCSVIILSIIGTMLPYINIRLPWSMDISLAMLLPFYLAYTFKDRIESLLSKKSIALDCIIIAVVLWLLNSEVNVREGRYGNIIMFYLCAATFTLGLFIMCHNWIKKEFKAKKYFLSIGTSSMIYMAFNQLIVWGPNQKLLNDLSLKGLILKTIVLSTTIFILYWIALIFDKSTLWQKITRGNGINKK